MNVDAARSPVFIGCIADDVTGATDLAINLVQGGARVVQWMGLHEQHSTESIDADAVVVSLKTRSVAKERAIAESLSALRTLQRIGCRRFYFKYCSTFDSTDDGNIGPVAEALAAELEVDQVIFCPAYPDNGRTVYRGHLFVHDRLLSESGMEHHPLNPMRDACLTRVLQRQTTQKVGSLAYPVLTLGPDSIARHLDELRHGGVVHVVTDACETDHLRLLAEHCAATKFLTGGSALARYLPAAYRELGLMTCGVHRPSAPAVGGRSLIISGSCSAATQRQVGRMRGRCPSFRIAGGDAVAAPDPLIEQVVDWARKQQPDVPLLVFSTASEAEVEAVQRTRGPSEVATAIELVLSRAAKRLVDADGFRRIIVAGGETAGAVVRELGVTALRIGPEIAPGVPWTETTAAPRLALALKSGNFGGDDFFRVALEMLP